MASSTLPLPTSASQAVLAVTIIAAAWLTFVGITPPRVPDQESKSDAVADKTINGHGKAKNEKKDPEDLIRSLRLTTRFGPSLVFSHIGFFAAYTAFLVYNYDPSTGNLALGSSTKSWTAPFCSVSSHGSGSSANGLSTSLLTWTPYTAVPLFIIILIGAPLRLIPYSALAQNFTFALAEPDRLMTSGIYSIVQHPSYTGLAALFFGNSVMYYRYDTPMIACLIPPEWYPLAKLFIMGFIWPAFVFAGVFGISVRVKQEERMLKNKFGKEWVQWHKRTARFIPGVF
ncbi:protein-S-isoprenylcysteine O-methyltransferase [Microdochium nivale]|nr:protein-S-isoprenylcysteine O-methyltransferase [Microdochium nivale]